MNVARSSQPFEDELAPPSPTPDSMGEFSEENRLSHHHIYSSDSPRFSQSRFEEELPRASPLPNLMGDELSEENRFSQQREEFSEETRLSHDHIFCSDSEWGIPDSQPPLRVAPSIVIGAAPLPVPRQRMPPAVPRPPRPVALPTQRSSPAAPRPPRPARVPALSEVRKLTITDFSRIVDWLEIPDNYAMLHGTSSRLAIGDRHPSKKTVFKLMLVTLHSKGFAPFVTTGENLGKRVTRYTAKFKEALSLKTSSGGGLTLAELRCGITLESKYEKICPHFARMDVLYGERSNVNPDALGSVGIRGVPEVYHEALPEDEISADTPIATENEQAGMDSGYASQAEDITEASTPPHEDDVHHEATEQNTANTGTGGNVEDGLEQTTEQNTANTGTGGNVEDGEDGLEQTPAPRQADQTPAPQQAPSSNTPRRQPINRPGSSNSQAASKTNVADIYLDKIAGKTEYRQQMINTKDKWANLELADRREARQELAAQLKETGRAQRKHDEKRAKREHALALSVARTQQTTSILQVLIQNNKTKEEIESLMSLLNR